MDIARDLAKAALEIKAIKLNPEEPFTWASGFRMPIYNDNRMLLANYHHRQMVMKGFYNAIMHGEHGEGFPYEIIAGTSTSGIPHATTLADAMAAPLIYVRDKPKGHGLQNQIEGIDADKDLGQRIVILIEDLISTGGSSARAVKAIRNANGECDTCLSIFNYGLKKAEEVFEEIAPGCRVQSLLTYDTLLEVAKETGYITEDQVQTLAEWREDPFGWGEKRGFPKVEK